MQASDLGLLVTSQAVGLFSYEDAVAYCVLGTVNYPIAYSPSWDSYAGTLRLNLGYTFLF